MKHLIWLVVILGMSANAETFRMIETQIGNSELNCYERTGEYVWKEWKCTSQDGYANLRRTLEFEVSCSSENIVFSIPRYNYAYSPTSLYEVGEKTMGYRELQQRLSSDYFNGTNYVIKKPVVQRNSVDIWFYGGRHNRLLGEGCGGKRVTQEESRYCHQVRTSGALRWSKIDEIQNEPLPIVTFTVSKDTLWEFLRQRQELSDLHDAAISATPENEYLQLYLWRVDYPNVKLIELGDSVGRRQVRTEQTNANEWSMFGRARASDGFHLPTDVDWTKIPDEISEELNRLQDYYNACQVSQIQTAPPPPPAQERPALDYSAINAKEYLKIMKIVDSVWDDYKEMTLEEYVNLP